MGRKINRKSRKSRKRSPLRSKRRSQSLRGSKKKQKVLDGGVLDNIKKIKAWKENFVDAIYAIKRWDGKPNFITTGAEDADFAKKEITNFKYELEKYGLIFEFNHVISEDLLKEIMKN